MKNVKNCIQGFYLARLRLDRVMKREVKEKGWVFIVI